MTSENISEQKHLDTSGLRCPEPVMLLHKAIREVQSQQIIRVTATDPSTERDIPKFCRFLGHSLLDQRLNEGIYEYWIKKK